MKHPIFSNVDVEQVRLIRVMRAGGIVAELPGPSSLTDAIQACQAIGTVGEVELVAVDRNGQSMVDRARVTVPRVPDAGGLTTGPDLFQIANAARAAQNAQTEHTQAAGVLERAHANEIASLRRNAAADVAAVRSELERELVPLRTQIAEFDARLHRQATLHAEELDRTRRRAAEDLAEANARADRRIEQAERARRDEIDDLTKRHDRQVDRLEAEAEGLRGRISDLQDRIARVNTETLEEVREASLKRVHAEAQAQAAKTSKRGALAETLDAIAQLEQSGASKESRELALKLMQTANSEPESPTAALLREMWAVAKEHGPQLAGLLKEPAKSGMPTSTRKEIA